MKAWALLLFLALPALGQTNRLLLVEQQNYISWQVKFLEPSFWIRYEDGLYFLPNVATDNWALAEFQTNRISYKAFTNRLERHALVNSILETVNGGNTLITESSNLYPALKDRKYLWLPQFYLLKSFPNGDALVQSIKQNPGEYLLRNLNRGGDKKNYVDGCFVYEGLKTYYTDAGRTQSVKSYFSLTPSLLDADKALLKRAHDAFLTKSNDLDAQINALKKK